MHVVNILGLFFCSHSSFGIDGCLQISSKCRDIYHGFESTQTMFSVCIVYLPVALHTIIALS